MNRRQPTTAALVIAASVVVLSLAALAALPLIVNERLARYRAFNEEHAEPARTALNEVSYRLSQQMALLTRAAATRDERYVDAYRNVVGPQEAAMRSLAAHRGVMNPQYDAALAELQNRIARWHSAVQRSVDSQRLAFDANYPEVIEAIHKLDEAITAFQADRRQQIRRLTRVQVIVSGALVLLAAIAALTVLWIIARLRTLATMFAEESEARRAALERQRELVRIRDEILGVVSHDLRSPLTTIALSTQLIDGSSEAERKEHVETILATTRRMQRLIQDLLDVTKIEHGRLSIKREMLDPAAIAREVVASHEPIAATKEIRLEPEIDEPLPQICGDADRITQALTNLVGNAFKFTPAGGSVSLSVAQRDGRVRFEVRDSGPGIAESDIPHLFEPFWQAKKTAHLGAGLGLKITRAIVEAHGGTIEAKNAPAGGACFTFEIPVEQKRDAAQH